MLGWMIVFALMTILGALMTVARATLVADWVCLMFGFLFVAGLLTRLVRGNAW